jgi:AcrR family transcriptional regulator
MQDVMSTSLRERMKRETNRAIARAAHELVYERALNEVTIHDIACKAGVSERTFFNYFSCKEAAVVGIPKEAVVQLDDELRARPAKERPLDALRAVLVTEADPDVILRRSLIFDELVSRYPMLLPHYLAALVELESVLARSLAARMGVDPTSDPSPRMLVASVLAALRTGIAWWEESGHVGSLFRVLDRAFDQMASEVSPRW